MLAPTHYRSASKGETVRITDMHDSHLANAIAKLSKGGLQHMATVNALRAEQQRRATM